MCVGDKVVDFPKSSHTCVFNCNSTYNFLDLESSIRECKGIVANNVEGNTLGRKKELCLTQAIFPILLIGTI